MSAMVMPGFHCISSARREISVRALGFAEAIARCAAFFKKPYDASASAIARIALRWFLRAMLLRPLWSRASLPGSDSARTARPSFGLTRAASVGFLRFYGLKRFLDV